MSNLEHNGIKRLANACRFSWQGLYACYQNEEAFRQEVWLFLVGLPLAMYLGDTLIEVALMTSALLVLMVVELLNSALEAVVDRIGLERHELSGRAKDMGSAAVTLTIVMVVCVWGSCLYN